MLVKSLSCMLYLIFLFPLCSENQEGLQILHYENGQKYEPVSPLAMQIV